VNVVEPPLAGIVSTAVGVAENVHVGGVVDAPLTLVARLGIRKAFRKLVICSEARVGWAAISFSAMRPDCDASEGPRKTRAIDTQKHTQRYAALFISHRLARKYSTIVSEMQNPRFSIGVILSLVVALVPLVIAPHLLIYFDVVPKVALVLLGSALLLLLFEGLQPGIAVLLSGRLGFWYAILVSAQICSIFISAAFSNDWTLAFLGTGWRRFGALEQAALLLFCFLSTACLTVSREKIVFLLRIICFTGCLAAAYGILQYLGRDPWLDPRAYVSAYGNLKIVRPPGTMGHATYFATYLLMVVFVAAGLTAFETNKFWRIAAQFVTAMGIVSLVLTGTRAGLLGIVAGGLVFVLRVRVRLNFRRILAAAALLVGGAAFYTSPTGARLHDRLQLWTQDLQGGPRLMVWRDSLGLVRHHLTVGVGPETFAREFPAFQSVELARANPDFYYESPHNICLDALISQGVPGLVLLILVFAQSWIAASQWVRHKQLGTALLAALSASFISQQFTAFIVPTAFFFHFAAGMLVAGATPETKLVKPLDRPTGRFFQALAIPVGTLFLVLAVQLVHVDYRWGLLRRALEANRIQEAMEAYRAVTTMVPPETGLDMWYSHELMVKTQSSPDTLKQLAARQALRAAARATAITEDRHNAYYNLAVLAASQGDLTGAEQALHSSIASAPRWFKPHWLLSEILDLTGRLNEAESEAQLAVDLNGDKNPEVADTLEEIRAVIRGH
jgi:O-antigen ligase